MLSTSLLLTAIACACLGFFFTCCCTTCKFGEDDFGRSDNTDINTGSSVGWTEVSGTWDITSGALVCSSAGIARCDTSHPDSKPTSQVRVDIDHNTSGSTVDVLVGYAASNDYYYARFTFSSLGGGSIEIRRNNLGIHSSIGTLVTGTGFLVPGSGPYTAVVCATAHNVFATIEGTGVFAGNSTAITLTGNKVALGCSGSGTATFDNFSVSKSYESTGAPSCPRCQLACLWCESTDTVPSAIQAVVNSGPYAGTYLCDVFVPTGTLKSTCSWTTDHIVFCSPDRVGDPTVTMSINTGTGAGGWTFSPGGGVTFSGSASTHTGAGGQWFFDDCTSPPTGLTTTTSHTAGCPTPLGTETCDLSAIT